MASSLKFIVILGVMMSVSLSAVEPSSIIEQNTFVSIVVPEKQLSKGSLKIAPLQEKSFSKWTVEEHSSSYDYLRKAATVWEKTGISEQYLVYGKQDLKNDAAFNWEVAPFYKTSTWAGRIWQQFLVLWRIAFGGVGPSDGQKQLDDYKVSFGQISSQAARVDETARGNDAFCNPEVVKNQTVLEGRTVNVLYNYAPIGFGGEKLHFLIVPKKHRTKFSDLSKEEYLEATEKAQQLMFHFTASRSVQDAYLFHKTGEDAGQTVSHWHLHLILTAGKTQDILGKLTVLKNMLFSASPMKNSELREKVESLRSEINNTQKREVKS